MWVFVLVYYFFFSHFYSLGFASSGRNSFYLKPQQPWRRMLSGGSFSAGSIKRYSQLDWPMTVNTELPGTVVWASLAVSRLILLWKHLSKKTWNNSVQHCLTYSAEAKHGDAPHIKTAHENIVNCSWLLSVLHAVCCCRCFILCVCILLLLLLLLFGCFCCFFFLGGSFLLFVVLSVYFF